MTSGIDKWTIFVRNPGSKTKIMTQRMLDGYVHDVDIYIDIPGDGISSIHVLNLK